MKLHPLEKIQVPVHDKIKTLGNRHHSGKLPSPESAIGREPDGRVPGARGSGGRDPDGRDLCRMARHGSNICQRWYPLCSWQGLPVDERNEEATRG